MPNRHAYIRPVPEYEGDPFESDTPLPQVLIVEDHDESADSLSVLLQMDGFGVARASDGRTALETARTETIDAVVLDVRLPGIDGFEVCRQLRRDPATSGLVIVMLTGVDDTQSKIEGLDRGADDYLVKPIASRELGARLRKLLELREARTRPLSYEPMAAQRMRASTVSQEIGAPLTAALGSLDLLLLTRELLPDVRRGLLDCQQHLVRIGRILSRID